MEMDSEMSYLQAAEMQVTDTKTAIETVNKIASIIERLDVGNEQRTLKQTLLNMAFRAYYKILNKYNLNDEHFGEILYGNASFEIQYAILLCEREKQPQPQPLLIKEKCLNALTLHNVKSALTILKILNLLCRRHADELDVEISLCHIYIYLQSNECGMREELILFFTNCCKNKKRAQKYFQYIMKNYSWTNRNKFYMLSCILNAHKLDELIKDDFYAGLRLSLSYKHLLPSSQYLVKALSKQDSLHLLDIIATILISGTCTEVRNLYAQWLPRLTNQKDELFQLLQQNPEFSKALDDCSVLEYRFVLIFVIYSRQIMKASKTHFYKISTNLMDNCFEHENESQFLIYKFIADNMVYFALEDCLEFLHKFIKHHRNIENAQMRHSILGKMPTIINFISKKLCKIKKLSLPTSVEAFFSQIHQIILQDVDNKIYQPKIFALKLLDILLKSLYQQNLKSNAKNCNIAQNELLGALLISHNVFDAKEMTKQLVKALYDPQGFDDALILIVELLQRLDSIDEQHMIDMCKKCCESVDIDECALAMYYANLVLKGYEINEFALEMLRREIPFFQADPLYSCKQRCHLFGYINVMNEVLKSRKVLECDYIKVLEILEQIEHMILDFLNANCQSEELIYAASFQDMDKSLEMLVNQSKFKSENHEEIRKFLLMSFWLTLKACCDVATTLGCHLAAQNPVIIQDLERCLNLNICVLTRCRHKGAIEAAGLSIGKLTKYLTAWNSTSIEINDLLWNCLSVLFDYEKNVSTTRRGAGYSIMLLHVIKNENQNGKLLLKRAMKKILKILSSESQSSDKTNCDRIEALALHYLCVLVKDAEIRDAIQFYYNDIMLAAIAKIDDPEWTICNASLQLFGALVPKIVGQRQATDAEESLLLDWEPTQITFLEILLNMPKIFEYMLEFCTHRARESRYTRSIILFLGFLCKVEHIPHEEEQSQAYEAKMIRFRELMWTLLQHACEKVRHLAATCFVRAHDFHYQLQQILFSISKLIFQIENENFFQGLVFVICEAFAKIKNEALHTVPTKELNKFNEEFCQSLIENAKFDKNFKCYTYAKFFEMLTVVGLNNHASLIRELHNFVIFKSKNSEFKIGNDELYEEVKKSIEII